MSTLYRDMVFPAPLFGSGFQVARRNNLAGHGFGVLPQDQALPCTGCVLAPAEEQAVVDRLGPTNTAGLELMVFRSRLRQPEEAYRAGDAALSRSVQREQLDPGLVVRAEPRVMEFSGQDRAITLVVQRGTGFTQNKPERLVLTARKGGEPMSGGDTES